MSAPHAGVEALLASLPAGARVLVQGCASETRLLAETIAGLGDRLPQLIFTGIRVPGVNSAAWLPNAQARFETFFMTPTLAAKRAQVDFLPFSYAQILRRLRAVPIDAAILAVTPPDKDGRCSFGPTVDFLAELWPAIPRRIAHINPLLPRVDGPVVALADLDIVADAAEPLVELADGAPDPVTAAIARRVAGYVGDGATLQTGLGKLPGAILRVLADRRNLRIHSGLIGDAVLDLLEAGAIARGADVTTGVALGTRRLYDALPGSGIRFRPVSCTHDAATIAAQRDFVAINSVMAIDLYGQGYSEVAGGAWNSGTGGATDFARGAQIGGGLRIVALPAAARGQSRIVPPGAGAGPVTLARTDIDIVVTEHGAADLRARDHDARAAALIAIAAPDHRDDLARAWRDGPGHY